MSGKPNIVGKRDLSGFTGSNYQCCDVDLCNDQQNDTASTPTASTSVIATSLRTKPTTSSKDNTPSTTIQTTTPKDNTTSITIQTTLVSTSTTASTQQPGLNGKIDSIGREFVIVIPMSSYYSRNIKTVITASDSGTVAICITANEKCDQFYLTQGENVFKFNVRGKVNMKKMVIESKSVTVIATVDISLLVVLLADNTGYDAYFDMYYLALPVDMLSTEYIASAYTIEYNSTYSYSYVAVAAIEDDTVVNFTLNIGDGFISQIPYMGQFYTNGDVMSIVLDKYQTFQVAGSAELTGTTVKSTKPVAVVSGAFYAMIISRGDEDFVTQMIPPKRCLQTKFILPPFKSRTGFVFRVIAAEDNTTIKINNNATYQISNNSSFFNYQTNDTEPVAVSSDKPVLVSLYAQSGFDIYNHSLSFNYGGGNMIVVPGISQFVSNYSVTVPSVPKYAYNRNESYISVISESSTIYAIFIDNKPLSSQNPDKYNVLLDKTSYDIRSFKVKPGHHNMYSKNGGVFGLLSYGFKWATGYGSPLYLNCP